MKTVPRHARQPKLNELKFGIQYQDAKHKMQDIRLVCNKKQKQVSDSKFQAIN